MVVISGETVEVLVEGWHDRKKRWFGRTPTDRLVFFETPGTGDWLGRLAQVQITWTGLVAYRKGTVKRIQNHLTCRVMDL